MSDAAKLQRNLQLSRRSGRDQPTAPMRYEGSVKHKEPWQRGRRGAICPEDVDRRTAQHLLDDSVPVDGARYAVHEGRAYCARRHGPDVWHGYPVGWIRVPQSLRRRWIEEGRVRRSDFRKHWD